MPRQLPVQKKEAPLAFFFLFLYTISVLVRPHEFSLETAHFVVIKVFAILSFLVTIIALRPIKLLPQHYMLLALVPLVMISAFLNGWGSGGISQAQRLFVGSIIPFFLYSVCITNMSRQHKLMYASIFAALMMVYNGHIQQASFDGIRGHGIGDSMTVGRQEMRITYLGFFSDPNDLGMFLVMNMPFLAYFFAQGNFVKKVIMLSLFGTMLYGVYMTGSRGTLLGTVGVIAVYYLLNKAGAKLILLVAISAPILATLIASFGGMSAEESSANGRLEAWYAGVLMLIHNPIFGIGMGNFVEEHGLVAHNSFIHIAGELGIPGYSLWGGVLVVSLMVSYTIMKQYQQWDDDTISEEKKILYKKELALNKALFFSMIGFMITAFFLSRSYSLLLFIFLGMLTASHLRIMNLRSELTVLFARPMFIKCIGASWGIIFAVYVALKVGL